MKLWEHLTKRSCRLEISRPERNSVREIIRKWYPGAPHLIWWSFQAVFSVVSSFVSFFIEFSTRKSSNSKLPAWSSSLISSALPSMLKYVSLISGILLMYCSEIAKLSLNLRQSSFFACARVFGKKFFVHIYFTMNCVQEVPIGFISWLSELYARLSPIPFMIQIFCNAICKIGLSW